MKTFAKVIGLLLLALVVALMTAWGVCAIYWAEPPTGLLQTVVAAGFGLATLLAFLFLPNRLRTLAGFLLVFAGVVAWWMSIPASNDRPWQRDVAALPYATVQGDQVTVHNIRNLNYRTETDFDVRYYDRTIDLARLDSVDLIAVYWMGDAIAHVMITFGFQEKDFVTFSIETRKEIGEGYSTVKGFFKQYELIFIAGDERDLIRVRTDYRTPAEDVYLYRTRMPPETARKFFMEYIREINSLKQHAQWYNTLTSNCTVDIVKLIRDAGGTATYNWKVLLSGYAPLYAYERGALDTSIPYEELRKASYVNPRARALGDDPEFSRKLREGLPAPWRKK
jgi:hypothetical protein